MRLLVILLALFIYVEAPAQAKKPQPTGQTQFNRAVALTNQGKIKEAIEAYRQLLHKDPKQAGAHHNIAFLYVQTNEPKKAEYHLKQAILHQPSAISHYNQLGALYLGQGRLPEAQKLADQMTQKFPNSADAPFMQGMAAASRQDWTRSKAQFEIAAKRNPKDFRAHYNIGMAEYEMNRFDAAAAAFQKSADLSPNYVAAWKGAAMAWEAAKKPDRALTAHTKVLSIQPDDLPSRLKRAVIHENAKRPDQALADYLEVLKRYPRNIDALVRAGALEGERQNFAPALKHFVAAAQLLDDKSPLYSELMLEIGFCQLKLRQYEQAQKVYAELLKANPKNRRAYEGQSEVFAHIDDTDLLIRLCRQWYAELPDDPRPLIKIAHVYSTHNQPQMADREYQAAIAAFADSAYVRMEYGQFLRSQSRHQEAVDQFDAVLKVNPKDAPALAAKAQTLEAKQDWAAAIEAYKKVAEFENLSPNAKISIAGMYEKMGKMPEAEAAYREAAFGDPPSALAFGKLIEMLSAQKRVPDAVDAFKTYFSKLPDPTPLYGNLAIFLAKHDRMSEARKLFEDAIAAKPDDKRLYGYYAFFLRGQNQHEEAIGYFKKLASMDPMDTWGRLHMSFSLRALNRENEALEVLREANAANPDDMAIYPVFFEVAAKLNREDVYEKSVETQARRFSGQRVAVQRYVDYLITKKRTDEASAFCIQALRARPNDDVILETTIAMFENQSVFAAALPYYERLAALRSEDVSLLRRWAVRAEEHGSPSVAVKAYRALFEAVPDDFGAGMKLAALLIETQQFGAAVDALREVVERHPNKADAIEMLKRAEAAHARRNQ